jgi:DNA polymerase I
MLLEKHADGLVGQTALSFLPFREIWAVDFEFNLGGYTGNNPVPVCLVAWELRSGRKIRLWCDEFGNKPPYPTDRDVLFIAYYASAEMGCHLALNWPVPVRILDLFTEFRNHTNGVPVLAGNGLLGALAHFGLDSVGAEEKDTMRALILRGGPWTEADKKAILDYCESDVAALARLLLGILPHVDLQRALLRGRYMAAAAGIERNGVPIDVETLALLRRHWDDIQHALIADVDRDYAVFEGGTFKHDLFVDWLAKSGIPWPRLDSGKLDLSDETFRQMARSHPQVAALRELRFALSQMRLSELTVGSDGRNRCLLSAFQSRTSRNQPSNTKFIFGPSVWLRSLIKPPPGYGLAYIDWKQQEFGIAAALSGDPVMGAAYSSGDPYLAFAKQAGAAPEWATKQTHGPTRELFKQCVLAVQYGMGEDSLAHRIGQTFFHARELLRLHHETYRVFWRWSDASVAYAMLTGSIHTAFGWRVRVPPDPNIRSLRNFLMQANGAEMLRIACCFATERGIEVSAPVHDAVLICAPLNRLEADIVSMQAAMGEASKLVLSGFELGTDVNVVRYPNRYSDARGVVMWERVMRLVAERESQNGI